MTLSIQDHFADPILDNLPSREIDIDNRSNSSELTYYQVTVDVSNHVDKQGMRFVDENLQIIDYWEEDSDTVWMEIPKITGSKASAIRMMHGDVDSASAGDVTFEFFDDFNRANGTPGSNWQLVGNISQYGIENNTLKVEGENSYHDGYASTQTFSTSAGINIRVRCKADGATSYYDHIISGISDHTPFTGSEFVSGLYGISLASDNGTNKDKIRSVVDGSFTIYDNGNVTQYHTLETKMHPTDGTKNYFNGQLIQSSDVGESINVYIYLVSNTGNYGHVDWIFVRKYTSPEPTAVIA